MKKVKEVLKNRAQKLGEEVSRLVEERDRYIQQVANIDIKLSQLAGAIHEFNKLIAELGEKNEDKN